LKNFNVKIVNFSQQTFDCYFGLMVWIISCYCFEELNHFEIHWNFWMVDFSFCWFVSFKYLLGKMKEFEQTAVVEVGNESKVLVDGVELLANC